MGQIHLIARLQELDSDILVKKNRLTDVLRAQKETDELLAARAEAGRLSAESQRLRARQRQFDLEIGGVSGKAQQVEEKLYSGKVQSPKELTDLQNNLEALNRHRSTLEDGLLEVLVALESVSAELARAEARLATVESGWQADQERLKGEQHQLAVELNGLLATRQSQAARIEPRTLTEYDLLRRKKGGVAAVAMDNGLCGRCRVTIPTTQVKMVREGAIIRCGNCDRILLP